MENTVDFAIVGAGVAGTYVAWRLAQANQSLGTPVSAPSGAVTIHLFEATKRIGGRLLTLDMPGTNETVCKFPGLLQLLHLKQSRVANWFNFWTL